MPEHTGRRARGRVDRLVPGHGGTCRKQAAREQEPWTDTGSGSPSRPATRCPPPHLLGPDFEAFRWYESRAGPRRSLRGDAAPPGLLPQRRRPDADPVEDRPLSRGGIRLQAATADAGASTSVAGERGKQWFHTTGDAEAPRAGYCAGRLSVEAVEACLHCATKEPISARAGSASGPSLSARR